MATPAAAGTALLIRHYLTDTQLNFWTYSCNQVYTCTYTLHAYTHIIHEYITYTYIYYTYAYMHIL